LRPIEDLLLDLLNPVVTFLLLFIISSSMSSPSP
jgi:hypothetical protein